jgi:KEOPS complex subunit Cgi121
MMVEKITILEGNEEFNIEIGGFESTIIDSKRIIRDLNKFNNNCIVQLMDANGIAGKEHVIHAIIHAIKSFNRHENISKDLGLEVCVRTSGQRQISKAIKMIGISNGKINVCTVAINCENNIMEVLENVLGERNDKVLEANDDKLKEIYNISDIESETAGNLTKLLMEKTALLILES